MSVHCASKQHCNTRACCVAQVDGNQKFLDITTLGLLVHHLRELEDDMAPLAEHEIHIPGGLSPADVPSMAEEVGSIWRSMHTSKIKHMQCVNAPMTFSAQVLTQPLSAAGWHMERTGLTASGNISNDMLT